MVWDSTEPRWIQTYQDDVPHKEEGEMGAGILRQEPEWAVPHHVSLQYKPSSDLRTKDVHAVVRSWDILGVSVCFSCKQLTSVMARPFYIFFSIDLSNVDKQTALIGMDRRMLVKHSIVITDVLTKFNIFGKLLIK